MSALILGSWTEWYQKFRQVLVRSRVPMFQAASSLCATAAGGAAALVAFPFVH